jgi:hypothetical protein
MWRAVRTMGRWGRQSKIRHRAWPPSRAGRGPVPLGYAVLDGPPSALGGSAVLGDWVVARVPQGGARAVGHRVGDAE